MYDNNIPMHMREFLGVKRLHVTARSPSRDQRSDGPKNSSLQATPPPKRERATNSTPSANPNDKARERGENLDVQSGMTNQASEGIKQIKQQTKTEQLITHTHKQSHVKTTKDHTIHGYDPPIKQY
jgi:hypothetical protein